MRTEQSGSSIAAALAATDLTVKRLWLGYLALGGLRTRQELQLYLSTDVKWPSHDRDLLARVLGEYRIATAISG